MSLATDRRYGTREEQLLSGVIEGLEHERVSRQRAALFDLMLNGPLHPHPELAGEAFDQWFSSGGELVEGPVVRAELLQFLRSTVRGGGQVSSSELQMHHERLKPLTFSALMARGTVVCSVGGTHREVICLQLVMLLQTVGLGAVRFCGVDDCDRMFVKTHRRAYCSPRCQKRAYMRAKRAKEAELVEGKARTKMRRRRARVQP